MTTDRQTLSKSVKYWTMDTEDGKDEGRIKCNDFSKVLQTDVVKSEPSEGDISGSEADFVDHDLNYASHHKLDEKILNPVDSDHSKFSLDWKTDCNDFNQAFEIDAVKNEPSEIDIHIKCESHWNSSSRDTDSVDHDHNYAIHSCQERIEEKVDAKNLNLEELCHSNIVETLSTVQIKIDDIDISYEDIKSETEGEKSNESIRFCEECHQSFGGKTEIFKSTSYRSECSCQNQNDSLFYNVLGEDMKVDVEPSFVDLIPGSGLTSGIEQDEMISEEVTKDSSVASQFLSEPQIQCISCSKSFNQMSKLIVHESSHIGEKPFNCTTCSKSFGQKSHLMDHERCHTGEKPFHCKFCSKSFSRMDHLKVHERSHIGGKPFPCKICSKAFNRSSNLRVHELLHTGEKPFHCKTCSKSFRQKVDLKHHEMIHHTGEKPFHCKICSRYFSTAGNLKIHGRSHTGDKPFLCKMCSKCFNHKSSLKIHERIHTDEKPFHCKTCSKSFSQMSNLKRHEMSHTGEKPFHCKICSRYFSRAGNLKIHERIHSGEKPFHCKLCTKSFGSAGILKIHERSHTGEKPFHCKICTKSFSRAGILKVHERSHTGEKPLHCKILCRTFSMSSNLNVDESGHAGEKNVL